MRTLVLGLGNLVHSDDGVGIHAIQRLQHDERMPAGIAMLDGGTHGMSLISHISGFDRVLVLDAIDAGEKPGTLIRMEGDALTRLPGKPSVHQLGFADLLIALRLLGEPPKEIVVLGVQPESTDWGAEPTQTVHASLDRLVKAALAQLETWSAV